MNRLSLLAHAATRGQRRMQFPADEGIEPLLPGVAASVTEQIGTLSAAERGPERRAAETAAALGIVASPHPNLRAWSMGAWAGQPIDAVAAREPAAFAAWRTDPDAAPPDGESLSVLVARVAMWLGEQGRSDRRGLVVADPTVVRAVVACALMGPAEGFWRIDIRPLSLTVIQRTHGEWRVRSMGLECMPGSVGRRLVGKGCTTLR